MAPGVEVLLADVGEDRIVDAITRIVAQTDPNVVQGIGDDAAAVRGWSGRHLLMTTDILVEGVHFRREWSSAHDVGWKAMAINLSDIAAMGGLARYALVSLALPQELSLRWVEDLYRGMDEAGAAFGVTVVGGNLAKTTGPITVDVTVIGEVEEDLLLRRTGARAGDKLIVTGVLGASAARLAALQHGIKMAGGGSHDAYMRPQPRLHESRVVARSRWATAMIDLSDGLTTDLWRLCEANGLGARVDGAAVPVDGAARQIATNLGVDAFDLAISGGEDYELLMAVQPVHARALADRIRTEVGTVATLIGELTPLTQGRVIERNGHRVPLVPRGWDHFRRP